jgi:hypothetical protein
LDYFVYGAVATQDQDQIGSLEHSLPCEDVGVSGRGRGQGARNDIAVGQRGNGTL